MYETSTVVGMVVKDGEDIDAATECEDLANQIYDLEGCVMDLESEAAKPCPDCEGFGGSYDTIVRHIDRIRFARSQDEESRLLADLINEFKPGAGDMPKLF